MINLLMEMVPAGIVQGLLLSMVCMGAMIPLRFLNLPDLTAEGSYTMGAVILGVLIMFGINPVVSTVAAGLVTGFLGLATALIHLRLKINTLLAGIIVSTMAYSINLRLMGKPNIAIFNKATLMSGVFESTALKIGLLSSISCLVAAFLVLFLKTEKGLRLRALGLNILFAQKQGISHTRYTLLGFFVGNVLCGLGGSLMAQSQGYVDIGMGVGIIIHALAALMIGEAIVGRQTLIRQFTSPLVGAIFYQQIQGVVLSLGLAPSDLKLFTGLVLIATIAYQRLFFKSDQTGLA